MSKTPGPEESFHSSTMSSPPDKRKRVRSESQLNQKRLTDRVRHRENRQENKLRLDKMENDISDIKAAVQSLTLHLQTPEPVLAPPALAGPGHRELALELSPRPSHGVFFDPSASSTPPFIPAAHLGSGDHALFGQQASWPVAPSTHTTLSWRRIEPKMINCRCGSPHLDQFDCIDQCTITTFYQHQVAFPAAQGPAGRLPRNPSLPAMMLHNMGENVATFLITGFLRQYRNKGMEQLLSFYLIGYRYMRVSQGLIAVPLCAGTHKRGSENVHVADFYASVAIEPQRRHDPGRPPVATTHRDPKA